MTNFFFRSSIVHYLRTYEVFKKKVFRLIGLTGRNGETLVVPINSNKAITGTAIVEVYFMTSGFERSFEDEDQEKESNILKLGTTV